MNKINEITTGKAKSLYTTDTSDQLIMHFRDDTSAFDGKKKEALLGKGSVNNQFNAFIMKHLESKGIETHHIEILNSTDSLVHKLEMFPIECVVRNRATGSICRRLGTEDGLILESPLFEFFLKDDDLGDPLITDEHILSFGWASAAHIKEMKAVTLKINEILSELFLASNLILVDFKVEFGITNNKLLLADEFTPDGCRLWDTETLETHCVLGLGEYELRSDAVAFSSSVDGDILIFNGAFRRGHIYRGCSLQRQVETKPKPKTFNNAMMTMISPVQSNSSTTASTCTVETRKSQKKTKKNKTQK